MTDSSFNTPSTTNRWLIVVAAVIVQLALGSVYAWSVFLNPVIKAFAVTKPAASLTFSITLVAIGITAGFGGYLQSRFGPRTIATAGGILYGLSIILAGLTTPLHSLAILYITYGIIGSIGIALGYIVPIAMLIRWFPDKRGLITGLAVAGFGGGAFFVSQIAPPLIKNVGLGSIFLYLGIAYLIIVVVAAQFFRKAPDNYAPAGWVATTVQEVRTTRSYTLQEALPPF